MRIDREKLLWLARAEAESRAAESDVISGYVIGSVAAAEPLLGDTTDIDLVLIHRDAPIISREMVPLSDEVHLDIAHQPASLYSQPRELRIHPWLGPSMCEPVFLFDPEHFFERAQAGVRGQFHRADHVHARALAFLQRARDLKDALGQGGRWLPMYLRSTLEGANAAACLIGFPAAGRRVALKLESQLRTLDQGGLFATFLNLHGAMGASTWNLPGWLSAWAKCFDLATGNSRDPLLNACRRTYLLQGFQALAEAERPDAAIWPLLMIWERALDCLELAGISGAHRGAFEAVLCSLELADDDHANREQQLETFLDTIEAQLEIWADRSGA